MLGASQRDNRTRATDKGVVPGNGGHLAEAAPNGSTIMRYAEDLTREEDMPRHEEQQTLAYTPDELFSVVANVKDYPSFVPWCTGAISTARPRRKSSLNSRSGSAHSGKALPARPR